MYTVLQFGMLGVTAFAIVHAARQRPDAYTAVDKLTKGKWLGILAGSAFGILLFFSNFLILALVAVVAVCVYLADVRPKVDEVQQGPRW